MGTLGLLRTRLRSLLGERTARAMPRRSRKPRIGAYVVHVREGLRLVAQAGMSDQLWQWMMERGWRVESYQPDRRVYKDVPASCVTRLIDADQAHWEQVLFEAIMSAQARASTIRRNA
jgi:hypothetical protein